MKLYSDALFEVFTFASYSAVFLVYPLVCREWNDLIRNRKFLDNYHKQIRKGIDELLNPKSENDMMFNWLEFISHSHPLEYEMGLIMKRTLKIENPRDFSDSDNSDDHHTNTATVEDRKSVV